MEACLCQDSRVRLIELKRRVCLWSPRFARGLDEDCLHAWTCWFAFVCVFKCALERISLPLRMCVSKILMRCQLDSSQLITGCTLGVSASLTHSHMLFPVLIFRLGRVMLASHSTHSLSLHSLCLSFCLSLHLCSLDVDHLPSLFVNLHFASWNICLRFSCFCFHLSLHHSHSHHAAMAKHLGNTVLYKIALKCNTPRKTVNYEQRNHRLQDLLLSIQPPEAANTLIGNWPL